MHGTLSPPRWKTAIENAISEYKNQTAFQLSTIDASSRSVPHVRSHIFREFVSSPRSANLPLLISSTDIRTPKVTQITAHPMVELAWWIEGKQQQFRIAGTAHVVAALGHVLHHHFLETSGSAQIHNALTLLKDEKFNWEAKRLDIFKSMSARMKASWCRPVPGSRLEGGEEEAKRWPERLEEPKEDSSEDDRKNWEMALNNFALVVIDPVDIDFVDLGEMPNRRRRYTKNDQGQWEEEELVP